MADETTRVEVGSDVPTRAQAPAAATSSPPADELPARVDRFVVLARLGSGGMGVVYGAYDPSLDRKVAVKLVRADVFGSTHSGEGRARLLREAQAMAQLSHPNVVAVHEVGEHAGAVFLAMEYVQGQTVRTWLKEQHQADPRRRRWRELVGVFLQAGEGLSAAHRAGLVHRDFKPDNVLVGKDGRVRVLDFGLARTHGRPDKAEALAEVDPELTDANTLLGTPAYMAPEQHVHPACDARGDQYAFCTALWEALAGARPFRGQTSKELGELKFRGVLPPPPKHLYVPRWIWPVLARGLRPDPAARYPDMAALLTALRADPELARIRVLVAVLAVALIVVGAWQVRRAVSEAEAQVLAARGRVCEGAASLVDAAWSDGKREALAQRFTEAGVASTWSSVQARLDDYAARWAEARTGVCRATRVFGQQSEALMKRRTACLDRALASIGARVDALLGAPVAAVRRAGEQLETPALELCTSRERNAHIDAPEDFDQVSALAARVDRLRVSLELQGAKEREGLAVELEALGRELEAVGYRPLLAALHVVRGRFAEAEGRYQDAVHHYAESLRHAEVGRDDVAAVDALTLRLHVTIFQFHRIAEAEVLTELLIIALERVGDDPSLTAKVVRSQALLAAEMEDFDRAAELYTRAIAYHYRAGEMVRLAMAIGNLGYLANRKGLLRDGVRRQLEMIELVRGRADAGPNAYTSPRINLGATLRRLGENADGIRYLAESEAFCAAFDEDDSGAWLSRYLRGLSMLEAGDAAGAAAVLERTLENRRRVYPANSREVAFNMTFLAEARLALGELAAAERLVAEVGERPPGDHSDEREIAARGLGVRGRIALLRGDVRGARAQLERAWAIAGGAEYTERRHAVTVLLALSDALWRDPAARAEARARVEAYLPGLRAWADEGRCDPRLPGELARWLALHPAGVSGA